MVIEFVWLVTAAVIVYGFVSFDCTEMSPKGSPITHWYEKKMYNSGLLTEEDKHLLSNYTEEQWCDLIPYELKVRVCRLTLKESVEMYRAYIKTGRWGESVAIDI